MNNEQVYWQDYQKTSHLVPFAFYHWNTATTGAVAEDVHLDKLTAVVSARLLHCSYLHFPSL